MSRLRCFQDMMAIEKRSENNNDQSTLIKIYRFGNDMMYAFHPKFLISGVWHSAFTKRGLIFLND